MRDIASNARNVFFVDDYSALNKILGELETSIFIGIEGELTVLHYLQSSFK